MQSFYEGMIDIVTSLAQSIISLLPQSPFREIINNWQLDSNFQMYLGWLNWFFPVSQILTLIGLWLSAYLLFLIYSIIMRWIKMIGD